MNKKNFEKRKKFITNTYMREALEYDIVTIKENDLFITIKKYKKMSSPFILKDEDGNDKIYLNDNYYLLEFTPLKENYNIRFYYDEKKNFVDYYIDISFENGVEYKMPYYVDLYLDIIHYPKSNTVTFIDEDELKLALDNKIINKKDYDLAYRVGNKLLDEIKNKTNKYLNMNPLEYINRFFK